MKHDVEDNKMKLSYNKELRATAVITLQLFHITSYRSTHRPTQYRMERN